MPNYWYWQNVNVSGGGFFQHIEIHPSVPDKVAVGCDIAGWYLWDKTRKSWNLIGDFSPGEDNFYGSAGFAWHPTDGNTFYLMAGKYTTGTLAVSGGVFKSTDGGKTLIKLNNFPAIPFGSNENNRRLAGSRVTVCPTNANIVLIGTFSSNSAIGKGIYKSADGGANWNQKTLSVVAPGQSIPAINNDSGITSICWDDAIPGSVYCSIFGLGISKSTDYGETWNFIGGAKYCYQMVCRNSTIYTAGVYTNSGELPADTSGYSGISAYNGTWSNILESVDCTWLDINKISGEISTGYPYELNGAWKVSSIFWKNYQIREQDYIVSVPYQQVEDPYFVGKGIGCLKYDPHYPGKAWAGDFYYIWQCSNYSPSDSTQDKWQVFARGIENTVTYDAVFIPEGTKDYLYTAWYDIFALKHDRGLSKAPSYKISGDAEKTIIYPSAYGFSYCNTSPQNIYVVGGDYKGNSEIIKSTDSGITWTKKQGASPAGRVAVSSTNPDLIIVVKRGLSPCFSSDGGNSWTTISALSALIISEFYYIGQILQPDPTNGNRFWALNDNINDSNYGKLYRLDYSTNTFTVTNTATLPRTYDGAKNAVLRVISGQIWVSLYDTGLYQSIDGGITFNKINVVQDCRSIAFGLEKLGSVNKTLYIYGKIGGQWSVWESNDYGVSWSARLDSTPYSSYNVPGIFQPVTHLAASQIEYGKLVLGTDGHGAFYSSASPPNVGGGGSFGEAARKPLLILSFR